MFLGSSFSGFSSLSKTATLESSITTVSFKNMVIGELYATTKVLAKFNWEIPTDWFFETIMHGLFQGDTFAGNVNYSESIVSKVKIKKRYQGDFTWKTIYEKPITKNEDFSIEIYDYNEPSNRVIEYAYVAVISNADTDTNTISTSVLSEFECYFLCEKEKSYPIILDTTNHITLNRDSKTVVSAGSKYPFVINNGKAKYYSGTLNATFIELRDCDFDVDNGWKYRNRIDDFLSNGNPKILKSFEGDMWMINVVGNIPRTENGHYQNISHQIDWVEAGNPNLISDLYDNGFIDTDTDRE